MKIEFKKLHPDAVAPKYATPGAAGFDLVAVEEVVIEPGETVVIPTGLAIEIPEGYELQIRPRSGITRKTKLRVANSPGTVDSDYRGEVGVIIDNIYQMEYELWRNQLTPEYGHVYNIEGNRDDTYRFGTYPEGTYIIHKGERIAQGVIAPVIRAEFIEVDELSETERGAGGFGHTGVKAG